MNENFQVLVDGNYEFQLKLNDAESIDQTKLSDEKVKTGWIDVVCVNKKLRGFNAVALTVFVNSLSKQKDRQPAGHQEKNPSFEPCVCAVVRPNFRHFFRHRSPSLNEWQMPHV